MRRDYTNIRRGTGREGEQHLCSAVYPAIRTMHLGHGIFECVLLSGT
jgi:hypothetical protein